MRIVDRPRFEWLSVMLDCACHFFHGETVKCFTDLAARFKLNNLH